MRPHPPINSEGHRQPHPEEGMQALYGFWFPWKPGGNGTWTLHLGDRDDTLLCKIGEIFVTSVITQYLYSNKVKKVYIQLVDILCTQKSWWVLPAGQGFMNKHCFPCLVFTQALDTSPQACASILKELLLVTGMVPSFLCRRSPRQLSESLKEN